MAATDAIRWGHPDAVHHGERGTKIAGDPRHRLGPHPRYSVPGGTVAARDLARYQAIARRL